MEEVLFLFIALKESAAILRGENVYLNGKWVFTLTCISKRCVVHDQSRICGGKVKKKYIKIFLKWPTHFHQLSLLAAFKLCKNWQRNRATFRNYAVAYLTPFINVQKTRSEWRMLIALFRAPIVIFSLSNSEHGFSKQP